MVNRPDSRAQFCSTCGSAPSAIRTQSYDPTTQRAFTWYQDVVATESGVLLSTDRTFPDGPGAEAVNNNCLACHSAGMVLTQPKLTKAQWTETVNKMVHVYKAPVDQADVQTIVDYLTALKPAP